MRHHLCTKDLYKSYLVASCVRYSGLALSEVSPVALSHDAASRWLRSKSLTPSEVWKEARSCMNPQEPSLLIADDTVLDKR